MVKKALVYGILLSVLLTGLKLAEYSFFSYSIKLEFYVGVVAMVFLGMGVWVGLKFTSKTEPIPVIQPNDLLSGRETEVLSALASGKSNQEANELFVSLPTVKTHLSNIYGKLGVRRRTQAVVRAKELGLT